MATNSAAVKDRMLEKLRKEGYFINNVKILRGEEKGDIIVLRRSKISGPQQYLPCPYCLGFVIKHELWRHISRCSFTPAGNMDFEERRKGYSDSVLLVTNNEPMKNQRLQQCLQGMRHDAVLEFLMNDSLILRVGESLLTKLGITQNRYVGQRMREVARVLLGMKMSLTDVLRPENFEDLIDGIKLTANFESNLVKTTVGTPSLALRVGHTLMKAAKILIGDAIISRNKELRNSTEDYVTLHEMQYSAKVSSHALRNMFDRKSEKVPIQPITEDLLKIRDFQEQRITELKETQGGLEPKQYYDLVDHSTTRLLIFNRRRASEAVRITQQQFQCMIENKQVMLGDLNSCLSKTEQHLTDM
jgi:hypothetical protein